MRDQDIRALVAYRLKEYSRTLHRAFNERQQDDYMPFVEMAPDELKQLLVSVHNMVNGISAHIKRNA